MSKSCRFQNKRQNAPARVSVWKSIFPNRKCPLNRTFKYIANVSIKRCGTCVSFCQRRICQTRDWNPGDWTNHHARALSVWRVHRAAAALPTRLLPFIYWIQAAATFVTRTAAQRSLSSLAHISAGSREGVAERKRRVLMSHPQQRSPVVRGARFVVGEREEGKSCRVRANKLFFPSKAVATFHGTPYDGHVQVDFSLSSPWSRGGEQRVDSPPGGREHRCPRRRRTKEGKRRRSSDKDAVAAVRGAESAAVPAAVRILPVSGESGHRGRRS